MEKYGVNMDGALTTKEMLIRKRVLNWIIGDSIRQHNRWRKESGFPSYVKMPFFKAIFLVIWSVQSMQLTCMDHKLLTIMQETFTIPVLHINHTFSIWIAKIRSVGRSIMNHCFIYRIRCLVWKNACRETRHAFLHLHSRT